MVVAVSLLTSGCNTLGVSLPSNINIPENDPSFRSRVYAGASIGNTSFDPDMSVAPAFDLANDKDNSSQMRIGYDMHNMLSLEVETGVLGAADLSAPLLVNAGLDVKYSSFSFSALIYGINGVQNRSRREGWSAYGRLGYNYLKRSSRVTSLDSSESTPIIGLGAEYGMKNGFGLRGEITRYDSDAMVIGVGAIYRFGMSAKQIGNVFADAAKPALSSSTTRVAAGGRVRGRGIQGAQVPQEQAQTNYYPGTALAVQTLPLNTTKVSRNDSDGDGVRNRTDRCPDTSANSTVGADGCGLFDATLSDVVFKPGSHWLTPKARGQLDKLSETLLAFPEARIQVRAHTDNKGPADLNMDLSERRAEAVVQYLQSMGIAELQLEAQGMGESQPMDSNDTSDGRKRNRRVEIATLSNIGSDMWDAINERAEAKKEKEQAAVAAKQLAKPAATSSIPVEPIFPKVPAVQLPAIPEPGYAAGFTMTGVVPDVSFVSDSAALTPDSSQALVKLSNQLKAVPNVKIAVMAHTDDQGEEDANKTLSISRALAVVDFLVAQGISKPRLLPEGYGESLPLVQNVTDADRARNRRIEVRVLN